MKKTDISKINKVIENLGWCMTEDDGEYELEKYSPAGQDFSINISANSLEEFSEKLNERYGTFDCSEEAYLWLDNTGHGKNGAPYDMKYVYEDMEACESMLEELAMAIKEII